MSLLLTQTGAPPAPTTPVGILSVPGGGIEDVAGLTRYDLSRLMPAMAPGPQPLPADRLFILASPDSGYPADLGPNELSRLLNQPRLQYFVAFPQFLRQEVGYDARGEDRYDFARILFTPAPFVEPPATYQVRVIQGFRDPLDPAYYSEGPVILGPPFSPAAPASPWFPGWPMGQWMTPANAQQASDVPGGGIGAGHGSHILTNTRGGGKDAWAWQDGGP